MSLATVRSGQILDWSSVDKTALLVFTPVPAMLIASARMRALMGDPTAEPYLDRAWLRWVEVALDATIGFAIVFAFVWWWIRKRSPESRWLTYGALAYWMLAISAGGYLLGEVSTPLFGGLLAVLCAILLFYDLATALRVVGFGTLAFFAPLPFVIAGKIPYGPVFREPPFAGHAASPAWLTTTSVLAMIITVVPVLLLAGVVRRWRSRDEVLLEIARLDPLTKAANRRYFFDRLEVELERQKRHDSQLAVLLLDLDHFKKVNDAHGHLAGDAALVHISELLGTDVLRRIDLLGRYGGEEFAILLPETDLDGAMVVAERCRYAIEASPCPLDHTTTIPLTTSIGVAVPIAGEDADSLVQRVDAALYQAKTQGRNRVVLAN